MNIVLIGFMGSGKSSVARALSQALLWPVIDLDSQIVELSSLSSVAEIFRIHGEEHFRQLETQACQRCAAGDSLILATGGGVVERSENLSYLRQHQALVVYLQAHFETLSERVGCDPNRPLFADVQTAYHRYQHRIPLYEKAADLVISVDALSVSAIVEQIVQRLQNMSTFSRGRHVALALDNPRISARTQICMIWGDPVLHSLSPAMHNAAYRALGVDDSFVFVAARVSAEQLPAAVQGAKAMGLRGVTCTIPHKTNILKYLDHLDPMAARIGAVNTVVLNQEGQWTGYNTDWLGIIRPLQQHTRLLHKRVAIIGAGGTARAAAFGVRECGVSDILIFNRTLEKGLSLAQELQASAYSLDDFERLSDCDILIQTTSVGMTPHLDHTPVPQEYLRSHHLVMDVVYTPRYTRLLQEAQQVGASIITGTEMFLHQGMAQFSLYTGMSAPEQVMRQVIEQALEPGSVMSKENHT